MMPIPGQDYETYFKARTKKMNIWFHVYFSNV